MGIGLIEKHTEFLQLIKLHSDISKMEIILKREKQIDNVILSSIINRLKAMNLLGESTSRSLLNHIPLEIFFIEWNMTDNHDLLKLIKIIRMSLEKIILSFGIKKAQRKLSLRQEMEAYFYFPFERLGVGYLLIRGQNKVLITAPHAKEPLSDDNIRTIAEKVAVKSKSWALISTISRIYIDYNRLGSRLSPFRRIIEKLALSERKIRMIIDLHGRNQTFEEYDVEIGAMCGFSAKPKALNLLQEVFNKYKIKASFEEKGYIGGDITQYNGIPPFVNVIQLELSDRIRKRNSKRIISAISEFIAALKF